ncbi:MAG: tRNA pseudouridine(55) synthase TruB [Elusimicrobia bacterium]|nr:tRNA pseudouridine(55) synthase TruB [Elusimicrobiota bacterium]
MDGLLLIHKPTGLSSYDVIRRIKRKAAEFRPEEILQEISSLSLNSQLSTRDSKLPKLGHSGTLDPFAEGLLIILLGRATKLSPRLMELRKTYQGTICLGQENDTDDVTGTPVRTRSAGDQAMSPAPETALWPSAERVRSAALGLQGTITQAPPAFSAIHFNGKRLYQWARSGALIEGPARPVTIYSLDIGRYAPPELDFVVCAGKGFYARSLARDWGRMLGCGAYLKSLKRTRIGPFDIDDSCPLSQLLGDANWRSRIISYDQAAQQLPS